jgi:hypothetical protein
MISARQHVFHHLVPRSGSVLEWHRRSTVGMGVTFKEVLYLEIQASLEGFKQ